MRSIITSYLFGSSSRIPPTVTISQTTSPFPRSLTVRIIDSGNVTSRPTNIPTRFIVMYPLLIMISKAAIAALFKILKFSLVGRWLQVNCCLAVARFHCFRLISGFPSQNHKTWNHEQARKKPENQHERLDREAGFGLLRIGARQQLVVAHLAVVS